MAGFEQGSSHAPEPPDAVGAARRARLGLALFAAYFLLYAAFMGLSAFAPDVMRSEPLWGLNLSVTYGFGLIAAALVLALVYGWLCRAVASDASPRHET